MGLSQDILFDMGKMASKSKANVPDHDTIGDVQAIVDVPNPTATSDSSHFQTAAVSSSHRTTPASPSQASPSIAMLVEEKMVSVESLYGIFSFRLLDEGAIEEFSEVVKAEKRIRRLSLGLPVISERGARSLTVALGGFLRCLSLRHCNLSENCVIPLAEALFVNRTLFELILDGNVVGDKGSLVLAKMLRLNETLSSLFLGSCSITPAGILAISCALRVNRTLAKLALAGEKYSLHGVQFEEKEWDAAWVHLCQTYSMNRSLHYGWIDAESEVVKKAVSEMLKTNTAISDWYPRGGKVDSCVSKNYLLGWKLIQAVKSSDRGLVKRLLEEGVSSSVGCTAPKESLTVYHVALDAADPVILCMLLDQPGLGGEFGYCFFLKEGRKFAIDEVRDYAKQTFNIVWLIWKFRREQSDLGRIPRDVLKLIQGHFFRLMRVPLYDLML